jgi:hypothetical protein
MKVQSSAISEVTYQKKSENLYVTFKRDGATYLYEDVPQEVYDEFMKADSKGIYFKNIIEPNYPYRKV